MTPGSISASSQLCSHRDAYWLDSNCPATELREIRNGFPRYIWKSSINDLYKQHYHSSKLLLQTTETALGTPHLLSKCCNKITFQDLLSLHIYVY